MKEQKTKSKKRIVYYILLAACVLLLSAATVLTVYFVTNGTNNDIVVEKPDDNKPDDNKPDDKPNPPDEPTGGDVDVFVTPVDASYTMEYSSIFSNGTLGWYYRHYALDFAAEEGVSVHAMTAGKIKEISLSKETGNYITIDHGNGLVSVYRFVEPGDTLKVGNEVKAGDTIGTVAACYGSEASEGTHLHFEVTKDGKNVDPTQYIEAVLEEK